jgi:hypothetical protein
MSFVALELGALDLVALYGGALLVIVDAIARRRRRGFVTEMAVSNDSRPRPPTRDNARLAATSR